MRSMLIASTALALLAVPALPAKAAMVFGLVGNDRIVTFDSADPATIKSDRAILGLGIGEVLTGIDIRPLDGLIYTVSTAGNVYRLQRAGGSYAATLTGLVQSFPPPGAPIPLVGSNFGLDFAPFDRIRLVSDADQNLRINPLNGGTAVDGPVGNGQGQQPWDLVGVAFADGSVSGAPFYGIDGPTSSLLRGALGLGYRPINLAGVPFDPLGIALTSRSDVGFDILFAGGINRAFLSANDSLYRVSLETGRATLLGAIGVGEVRGITTAAYVPEPAAWAMLILGFGIVGSAARRRAHVGRPHTRV